MTERAVDLRAQDLERSLLGKWPNYLEWLDEPRLSGLMNQRFAGIRVEENPFPHVFVTDFLPETFYAMLADSWPPIDAFRANKKNNKLDLVPRDDPSSEFSGRFSEMPDCVREVWSFFAHAFNRRIVGPWLAGVFAADVETRVSMLRDLGAAGRLGFTASGIEGGRVMANSGRLMMRGNGYTLAPHVDPAPYVVTALHYFGTDHPGNGFGTRLYRAAQAVSLESFVADGTTQYFGEQNIPVEESVCLPFTANSFLAFPNRLNAAHGVIAPEQGYRKVFQYHLSLKGDQEPL